MSREWGAHFAQNFATVFHHHRLGITFERMAKGVVSGQKEPGVASAFHDGLARTVGQHPGVVGPVDGVGVARLASQVSAGRA